MTKCLVVLILIWHGLPAMAAGPVDVGAARKVNNQLLSPVETQRDFDFMRAALEEGHAGLYRYTPKAEMDAVFDAQRALLIRPMTRIEFLGIVSETLSRIRCGHTGFLPDDQILASLSTARLFPLQVRIEGQRIIVLINDTPDNTSIRPGMEILAINGESSDHLLSRLLTKIWGDGDIATGKRAGLQEHFAFFYWLFASQTVDFLVKAKDSAGTLVSAKLAGVLDSDRAGDKNSANSEIRSQLKNIEWTHEDFAIRFFNGNAIAEVRVGSFNGTGFPTWIETTFRSLQEKGTRALILDLRGNDGGEDTYGAMLVAYLTNKTFNYLDRINIKTIHPSFAPDLKWYYPPLNAEHVSRPVPSSAERGHLRPEDIVPNPAGGGYLATSRLHPGLAEQAPGKYPFLGRTFVLMDGGTFSTAADFCAVAHHLKIATFIGQESGGGYYGNNSGTEQVLVLPTSKLMVRIPMYEYWNAVHGSVAKRRGTPPDYDIEPRVEDLIQGSDKVLDRALELAGRALH